MTPHLVTPSVEQHSIIIFLVKEKVKPAEILCRLHAHYGEETLLCERACDWCRKFSEGHKGFFSVPHAHVHPVDSEGVIHVDLPPHGLIVNAQYYSNLLCSDLHQMIWKKKPGKLSEKITLLNDNTHLHTKNLMVA
jgi:hypothetical protein